MKGQTTTHRNGHNSYESLVEYVTLGAERLRNVAYNLKEVLVGVVGTSMEGFVSVAVIL